LQPLLVTTASILLSLLLTFILLLFSENERWLKFSPSTKLYC